MNDFYFDIELWQSWKTTIFWSLTIIGVISALYSYNNVLFCRKDTTSLTIIFGLYLLIILGLFPIEWGYGSDRANYANIFLSLQQDPESFVKDPGFTLLTISLGRFLNVTQYFITITLIYLINYYITIKKLVRKNAFWLMLAVTLSMGFTSYVLNTMRAGIALSFIVLSFGLYPSKWKMAVCLFVASALHTSAIIPSIMVIISYFFNNTKLYYKLWFLAIPLSLVAGSLFMGLFAGLSTDERTSYLSQQINSNYNIGFRVDFIIYSLLPIAIGAYYIFKKGFKDNLYQLIYNSYILTNIFWILVIRANYSDRFAYLSWFMIPFVLVYPIFKHKMRLKANVWFSMIIIGETIFRFLV